jgi:hypothetical protein
VFISIFLAFAESVIINSDDIRIQKPKPTIYVYPPSVFYS